MSLLSWMKINRPAFRILFAIVVFVFLALPVPSSIQSRVSAVGPSVVWASSPDETLKPPPAPPKKAAIAVSVAVTSNTSRSALLSLLWRVYWATVRL